jgi:carbon-monoxide dehydrogenase small subunit
MTIRFTLNSREVELDTDPLRRLLDVLREDFGLAGVKEGCGEGECGACSVIIDGELANSCIVPVGTVRDAVILTIEGYRETERYRVLEKSFAAEGSVQCGFCTPGFVMAAEALLSRNTTPDEEAIREGISGNLCRCTGYHMIVEGIARASRNGAKLWAKPTDH